MDLAELEARESIRSCIAAYAHAADRGRFAELAALFSPEGALEIEGWEPARGRAAIVELLETAGRGELDGTLVRHHVSSVSIEVTGRTEAHAWAYFLVIRQHGPDHWGRYADRFTRTAEGWRFETRRVKVDGRIDGAP